MTISLEEFGLEIHIKYSAVLISVSDTKLVHRTLISFKCNCNNTAQIEYRQYKIRGALCRKCCYKKSIEKRKITIKAESINEKNKKNRCRKKLVDISNRDNCIIVNIDENITNKSIISLICSCGNNDNTSYRNIRIRGGYCKACSYKFGNVKRRETFLNKYGTTHPSITPHIIEKTKKTNLLKFGVEHPAQSPLINCNTYKTKEFISENGKKFIVQGYEDIALKELLKEYSDNDIVMGKKLVPKITYLFNNKNKYYYPDIYIPKDNKIIEVKSTWTYKVQEERNILKATHTKNCGYNYEFWIYNNKHNKQVIKY